MRVQIPKPFLSMPSDKCRVEPTSACQLLIFFNLLPAARPYKSLLAKEGGNAFHLAFKSGRGENVFDWHFETCYQKGVAGLIKYIKDQRQCRGEEGEALYLGSQCADYITDVTVLPGKFLILLRIQEPLVNFQKQVAALIKGLLSGPQVPVLSTDTQSPPTGADEQTSPLLSRRPVCS